MKKENVLILIFVSLIVGFIGGVVFSAYKMGPKMTSQPNMPPHVHPMDAAQLEKLKDAVEKSPKDLAAWIRLANFYFDAAEFDNAIKAYENALNIEPNNADVLTDLGVMYRRNGNPEAALSSFQKAYQIKPGHETAMFNAGVVLMHDLKKPDDAKRIWRKLVEINPNYKTPTGISLQMMVK